jgi:hypothetical protein
MHPTVNAKLTGRINRALNNIVTPPFLPFSKLPTPVGGFGRAPLVQEAIQEIGRLPFKRGAIKHGVWALSTAILRVSGPLAD